jgi:hypothetical protein
MICLFSGISTAYGYGVIGMGLKLIPKDGLTGVKWAFETAMNEQIPENSKYKLAFVDLYGIYQNFQLKRTDDGLGFFKDQDGYLLPNWEVDGTHDEALANIRDLYDFADRRGTAFRYIQIPANELKSEYPHTVFSKMATRQMAADFVADCKIQGIPCMDAAEFLADLPHGEIFDRTDHHWTGSAVFLTYQKLMEEISAGEKIDADRFEKRVWKDSFLGSLAVGMGQYYVGKEDYSVYEPDFDTSFTMKYCQGNDVVFERDGDFLHSLYDVERLDDPLYYNKYDAALSSKEVRWSDSGDFYVNIENHLLDGGQKVMLISDSYGQPFATYLALSFQEVAFLSWDGYYTQSYEDFIEQYDPDVVLVLKWGQSAYVPIPLE